MLKSIFHKKSTNKVYKNYLYLLLIQGANFILPLITFPYLVRVLGSEKYGLVMIAQSLAIVLTVVVDFGFNISATREVAHLNEDKEKLSQYYWNVIFIKVLLIILTFLGLLLLTIFVNKFSINPLVYLYSFGLVLGQAIFPTWFFQGIEKMQVITIINVTAKTFFTLAIFSIILSPNDYLYVPILNGLGIIISGFVGFLYSLKYVNFIPPKIHQIKSIIRESFNLFISNFAVSLYTSSNTLILGFFGGDSIAGIYASVEKLVIASKSIYIPLYQAIFPFLAKKNSKDIYLFINKIKWPIAISGLIISLGIIFYAKFILNLAFNDDLITSYYIVFQIVSLIALFSSINMLFVTLYFPSIKKYNLRVKVLVFSGLFHIVLVIILAYFYSIFGVAISASITELLILIYAYTLFKKQKE